MNVCFLPGSLCDERVFAAQIAAIEAVGHSCTVADLAVHNSIEDMAAAVVEQLHGDTVVVGLSLGAIVAAEAVTQAPDRIAGVALMNTNLDAPDERQLDTRNAWTNQVRVGEFACMVVDNLTTALTAFPQQNNELIFEMAMGVGPTGFLAQNSALLNRRDRRNDLLNFDGPVLILAGSNDHLCPPAIHRQLQDRLPASQLTIVDGAGHLSTLDRPAAVNSALLEWLTLFNPKNSCPDERQGTTKIQTQEGIHEYQHA